MKNKDVRYWRTQLVHRKYTELADPRTAGHFSARIEHDGTGCYFPLGSADDETAALRAGEIHRCIRTKGWARACQRFAREFTLAVFWSINPLLCTYTTLITIPGKRPAPLRAPSSTKAPGIRLALVEADDGVRQGLIQWGRHVPGCVVVGALASSDAASTQLHRSRPDLLLLNRGLADLQPALAAAGTRAGAPAAFTFGVYETSDDIFISHTGVSQGYFLHRTAPAQVLAPITGAWMEGSATIEHVRLQALDYFQNLIAKGSAVGPAAEKAALTPREEEILLRLSKGYQDKQIADTLNISTWTVHNHIKNIFKKLGVHTRTQAVIKHLQR